MSDQEPVATFESLLDRLREQVARLETEQLPLAEAVAAYENSISLANQCHELLEEAQLRIQKIDASARSVQEVATPYVPHRINASALLLGDDDEDLMDLMDDE